jgi:hypothetical protein
MRSGDPSPGNFANAASLKKFGAAFEQLREL